MMTFFKVLDHAEIASYFFKVSLGLILLWTIIRIVFTLISIFRKKDSDFIKPASVSKNIVASIFFFTIVIATLVTLLVKTLPIIQLIDFDYFLAFALFIITVLLITLAFTSEVHKSALQIISVMFTLLALYIAIAYISGFGRVYSEVTTGYTSGSYLSMNFTNPNAIGSTLLVIFVLLILGAFAIRFFVYKALNFALMSFMFFLICLTESRNSIIAICLFVIILVAVLIRKKNSFSRPFTLALILAPLILAALYLISIYFISFNTTLKELILDSQDAKSLGSRYETWIHAFNVIGNNILFGDHVGLYFNGIANLHNIELDIFANFGLFPILLFVLYLYFIISSYRKGGIYFLKAQAVSLCLFIGTILSGAFDYGLLNIGDGYALVSLLPLVFISYPLANNSIEENNALIGEYNHLNKDEKKQSTIIFSDEVMHSYRSYSPNECYLLREKPFQASKNIGYINALFLPEKIISFLYSVEAHRIIWLYKPNTIVINPTKSYTINYKYALKIAKKQHAKIVLIAQNREVLCDFLDNSNLSNDDRNYLKTSISLATLTN